MCSAFSNAVTAAHAAIAAAAGETVIYARGNDAVQLVAVPGQTTAEQQTHQGLHAQITIADFLIAVDDLVLDEQPIEPKSGDRIYREVPGSDGSRYHQYEVSSLDGGSRPWRHSDTGGTVYRIHTKRIRGVDVGQVPAPAGAEGGGS